MDHGHRGTLLFYVTIDFIGCENYYSGGTVWELFLAVDYPCYGSAPPSEKSLVQLNFALAQILHVRRNVT